MHEAARSYVARVVAGQPFPAVVEVGGRWINGGVKDLIDHKSYISLDLHEGAGVDVVADVRDWVLPGPLVDLVVCCEVIEHSEDPAAVVAACIALLAPGGRLVLTCAGPDRAPHSGLDGGPVRDGEYYANIEPDELAQWLDGLADVDVEYHPDRGDLYATGTAPAVEK